MRAIKIPRELAAMVAAVDLPGSGEPDPIVRAARVAGCGSCGGNGSAGGCGACGCDTFPPGKGKPNGNGNGSAVPMTVDMNGNRVYNVAGGAEYKGSSLPCAPYSNPAYDAQYMTRVVGEATIAAGATATINIQPTMGCFDGFYVTIISVDNAAPNNRGRVLVARWFVGDCPGDCRTIPIFSDVYDGTGENGCCVGVPMRTRFGRTNNGEDLHVDITNPVGGFGNAHVQVIITGVCHRGSCAC